MPLVTSLLTAIARADGDALVLHSGERPYVIAPKGQSELSSRVLTLDAMTGMLREMLPEDSRRTLDEFGAVQHDIANPMIAAGERFTVVAARGGDDIWIEIRRHRQADPVIVAVPPEPVIEAMIEPIIEPVMAPAAIAYEPIADLSSEPVYDLAMEPEVVPEPTPAPAPTMELIESEPEQEMPRESESEIHEISFDTEEFKVTTTFVAAPASLAPRAPEPLAPRPMAASDDEPESHPAVVLPLARHQVRDQARAEQTLSLIHI